MFPQGREPSGDMGSRGFPHREGDVLACVFAGGTVGTKGSASDEGGGLVMEPPSRPVGTQSHTGR